MIRVALIGLGAAVLVSVLEWTSVLAPFERWLYDRRARYCQWFSPSPTDRIVHLDIDDTTLEEVGSWPWRRADLARIIDEIARCGPKVIAADVVFVEPQGRRLVKQLDGKVVEIDDDMALADSLARSHSAIPFAYQVRGEPTPTEVRVLEFLLADLEVTIPELVGRLKTEGFDHKGFQRNLPGNYVALKQEAMDDRINEQLDQGVSDLEGLRALLLPKTDPLFSGSAEIRMLAKRFQRVMAVRALKRLGRRGMIMADPITMTVPPIPAIARAISVTGFVDYMPDADGVIRQLPLWAEQDGVVYPQFGLALALAALGVDLGQVRVERNRVVIPRSDGPPVIIPVHQRSQKGRSAAMLMWIPWFGHVDDWQGMYDRLNDGPAPADQGSQHIPVNRVYQVLVKRNRIAQNLKSIDAAMRIILDDEHPQKTETRFALNAGLWSQYENALLAPEDDEGRLLRIERTLQEVDDSVIEADCSDPELTEVLQEFCGQWFTSVGVLRTLPGEIEILKRVVEQERAALRNALNDRVVLIGWTATAAFSDTVRTPLHGICPGVVVHGVLFNGIMTGQFWALAPLWISHLCTLMIGVATAALATILAPTRSLIAAMLLAGAYLATNAVWLFDYANLHVFAAGPLVAVAVVWTGCTLSRYIIERTERARITRRFSSYVDPMLVNYIVEHPEQAKLEGQVRELTVVFTDLAGFTTISEKLREKTVALISDYLGTVVPLIRSNRGYVNKFLGDGIMFFYGAPLENANHAADAIATVIDLQKQMVQFNQQLASRQLPQLKTRAGMSTGQMVVGDAGPADASDYTVLGDFVNLAARLESANKATGTLVLATDRTIELCGNRFLVRPVGHFLVVGKSEGVMVYEPLAYAGEATEGLRNLADLTQAMVQAQREGKRERCRMAIDQMEKHLGSSLLTGLYRELVENSDSDFGGPIVLAAK